MGRILRSLGMLLVLLLTVAASPSPNLDHSNYLPVIIWPRVCPPIRVFDYEGQEQDWAWLQETFGAVSIQAGSGSLCASELRAVKDDATLMVRVLDAQGQPVEGITVVFYWPDAPALPPELVGCFELGVYAATKYYPDPGVGTVGFGMGPGAYYQPPAAGPHTVWVGVNGSECVLGLGMLWGTNHYHLDPTFVVR